MSLIPCSYCPWKIDTSECGWGYYYLDDQLLKINFHTECFQIYEGAVLA